YDRPPVSSEFARRDPPAFLPAPLLSFPTPAREPSSEDRGMPRASRFCLLAVIPAFLIFLACPGAATAQTQIGAPIETVDFERHMMGLFGRMGCNMGSCHGSFQGKGGFRLSLFGYDPEKDYFAVTHDNLGRRINRRDADN